MPCIRDDNGLPVPGAKGTCPAGSTWSDGLAQSQFGDAPPVPLADRVANQRTVADTTTIKPRSSGNFLTDWYSMKGTGVNTQDGSLVKGVNLLGDWKNYFMGGLSGSPESAKRAVADGRAATQVMADVTSPTYKGGRGARGDRKPPKELSKWEQLSANFKDPEWWMKSMSGLPHDTRLHRLGMLMDYYGRTPKGRTAVDMPSTVWASNEQEALKNRAAVLAAQAKNNPTFLSKMSSEDQDLAIRETVRDKLGFSDWIPLNEASGEDLEQTIAMVKGLIQQYVQEGDSWTEAYKRAMNQVEK
jgi:hypothetical protein